tara:strand:- start:43 stop:519 length:477 start_codon:yes stop_codon:yes gene_type:complete
MTKSQKQARLATIAKAASSKPQGHMPTMAQRAVQAKIDAKANNDKLAKRDFTAHLTRGASGANLSMTVMLGADVDRAIASIPKQCRLMCQYLVQHNEVATFQQLNDYADKADGVEFWGKGTTAYEQSVAKIASHYMPKLLGEVAWSKKLGKLEVIRLA